MVREQTLPTIDLLLAAHFSEGKLWSRHSESTRVRVNRFNWLEHWISVWPLTLRLRSDVLPNVRFKCLTSYNFLLIIFAAEARDSSLKVCKNKKKKKKFSSVNIMLTINVIFIPDYPRPNVYSGRVHWRFFAQMSFNFLMNCVEKYLTALI